MVPWFGAAPLAYRVRAIDSTGTSVLVGELKRFTGAPAITIFADIERTCALYRIRDASLIGATRYLVVTAMDAALGCVEGRWVCRGAKRTGSLMHLG